MIKKYLTTPEEILALKDTDTKIYIDGLSTYYQYVGGVLCRFHEKYPAVFNCAVELNGLDPLYILVEEPVKEADEKWRVIDEFPDYEVSSLGRVFSKKRNRMLKPYKSRGYEVVDLGVRSENRGARYVHRLVATAFIENPENKEEVNHKNSKRDDNRIENLEWVTPQENVVHSYRCGKQKYASRNRTQQVLSCSQPIVCVETGIRYFSISDASRKLHIHTANIARCVKNNKKAFMDCIFWHYQSLKLQRLLAIKWRNKMTILLILLCSMGLFLLGYEFGMAKCSYILEQAKKIVDECLDKEALK